MAEMMKPSLKRHNVDVKAVIYNPDGSNMVYIGLKLVFPDAASAQQFMELLRVAQGEEE